MTGITLTRNVVEAIKSVNVACAQTYILVGVEFSWTGAEVKRAEFTCTVRVKPK